MANIFRDWEFRLPLISDNVAAGYISPRPTNILIALIIPEDLLKIESCFVIKIVLHQVRLLHYHFFEKLPINPVFAEEVECYRSAAEEEKCFVRDGHQCVVTGACNPVACHITPWFWSKSERHIVITEHVALALGGLFGEEFYETMARLLANPGEPGSADYAWNQVCLSPELRDLWRCAYWGFEPKDIIMCEDEDGDEIYKVILIFRWTYRVPASFANELEDVDQDLREFIKDLREWEQGGQLPTCEIGAYHAKTGEPIRSGQHVEIRMGTAAEADRFFKLMQIQWACVQIHAMSGGTGSVVGVNDEADSAYFDVRRGIDWNAVYKDYDDGPGRVLVTDKDKMERTELWILSCPQDFEELPLNTPQRRSSV